MFYDGGVIANKLCRMDFLVNVLGYKIEDAQRSIETQKGMVNAVESLQAGL